VKHLLFILVIFSFTGCREGFTPEQPVPVQNNFRDTQSSELTANNYKAWRIVNAAIDSVPLIIEPCEADDRYTFYMDGQFSIDPVFALCDSTDTGIEGNWYFEQDKSILVLQINQSYGSYTILNLSNDTFRVQSGAFDTTGAYLGLQTTTFIPY
jgi:hypothetical protein